jgi:hypothetical protein
MEGGSLCSGAVGFIAHGMDAACVDPAVVEIEERADGDGVVDGFVGEAGGMQHVDVAGLDVDGIFVHFAHEAEESFVGLGEQGGFEVCENTRDKGLAAE